MMLLEKGMFYTEGEFQGRDQVSLWIGREKTS